MTSARVAGFSLNRPRTADVTVSVPGLRTPRIDMQRCSASIITNAPRGASALDERVGDLRREPLLHLRSFREAVDEPRELRQTGDASVVAGDVRDVRAPVERDQVVFADAVERDVAHQHHLVVVGLERDDEMTGGIVGETGADLGVHLRDARRRAHEAVAVGVFADRDEDLAHGLLDAAAVDRARDVGNGVQRFGVRHDVPFSRRGHGSVGGSSPAYSATNGRLR